MFSYAFPEMQVQQCWSLGKQYCPAASDVSEHCLPPGPDPAAAAAAAAAGTGLAGSSAAELLSDVEPRPPSSGLVPVFSKREKLNYCRLLLLASQELHLVRTSSDVFSARGRNKGVFCTLKQAGVVLWEGVSALFDNPFSCFLGC